VSANPETWATCLTKPLVRAFTHVHEFVTQSIAKVVGWRLSTVIEMAERYGHFEESALRRAVEAIAAAPTVPQ